MRKLFLFIGLCLISNLLFAQTVHQNDNNQILRIPLVFHIYHDGSEGNFTESEIRGNIPHLNENFNNVDLSEIELPYRNDVASNNIEFYIPNGMIYWYNSSAQYAPGSNQPFDDAANYADSNNYLNVVVANISGSNWYDFFTGVNGAEGYSTGMGVVVGYQHFYYNGDRPWAVNSSNPTVPSFSTAPFLLAHEIGHHLSLEHLWGDLIGCSGDDGVSDTPKQAEPNDLDDYNQTSQSWNNIVDICGQSGVDGNYENFMDYSYALPSGKGMFTNGQKTKMRHYLLDNETDLIEQIQENDNCSDEINLNTSSSINSPYLKGSVYNATSENFPGDPISCDNGQGSNFSGRGVWYSFIATSNNNVIDVKRDPNDQILPVIAVYGGSSCNNLTNLVDCSVMNNNATFVTTNSGNYTIGQRYYIRIYHKDNTALAQSDALFEIRVLSGPNTTTSNAVYNAYRVKDGNEEGIGNDDNLVNIGESIDLDLRIKNTGDIVLTNVSATLSTNNQDINITDNVETFANINTGALVWSNDDFDFDVLSSFTGSSVDFELTINSDQGTWYDDINIPVSPAVSGEPKLEFDGLRVKDGTGGGSGNSNEIAESGESIDLEVRIENIGNASATSVEAILFTNDPYITITDNREYYNDIAPGQSLWCNSDFDFDIDSNCPNRTVTFSLAISSSTINWVDTFTLNVVRPSGSSGGVELEISDYRVKDGSGGGSGNNNGQIEPGESIDLDVELDNVGSADATRVKGDLIALSPGISVTDYYEYWGDIDSGRDEWESDFDFDVPSNYSPNLIIFRLDIRSDEGAWTDYMSIPVNQNSNRSSNKSSSENKVDINLSNAENSLITDIPKVYPNPLSEYSNLHLVLNKLTEVNINLIDIQGRIVRNVFSGSKDSGKYTFSILDGESISSGLYILQVSQDGETNTIKLVKK